MGQDGSKLEEVQEYARQNKREAHQQRAARELAEYEAKMLQERLERDMRAKEVAEIKAMREKESAAEKAQHAAEKAEREKRKLNIEMMHVTQRAEAEEQAKQAALFSLQKQKAIRENEKKEFEFKIQRMKEEKDRFVGQAKQLLFEKEERERVEDEQRRFKWGPEKPQSWTEREMKRLIQFVLQDRQDIEEKPISLKLLVFGPTGHGKSSFCNGCRSAVRGDDCPSSYYPVADIARSLTRGFHSTCYGNHWLIDMAGIYESNRIDSSDIEDIASGKVPFYAKITDTFEMKDKQSTDLPAPGKNDVSCVIIVLRYDTELGPELKRQIEVIIALGGKGVLSYHLVLTRLDECDPQFNVKDNLPNLHESPKVQAAVKRMSEETGIPPYAISFVKNYTKETETNTNSSLLHLRVLERVIKSGLDQVEKEIDKKRQKAMYNDRPIQINNDLKFVMVVLLLAVLIIYLKI